jgi:hypothetical protein
LANKKIIPPRRSDQIIDKRGQPTPRAAQFFEEISSQIDSIADVTLGGSPTANEILLRDKINEILDSLRNRGLLAE